VLLLSFVFSATIKCTQVFMCVCPIFLSEFNQLWALSTDFYRSPQHNISLKSVPWELQWYMQMLERWTLECNSAFRNYTNVPKKWSYYAFRTAALEAGPKPSVKYYLLSKHQNVPASSAMCFYCNTEAWYVKFPADWPYYWHNIPSHTWDICRTLQSINLKNLVFQKQPCRLVRT
jgi:hypothetical protein